MYTSSHGVFSVDHMFINAVEPLLLDNKVSFFIILTEFRVIFLVDPYPNVIWKHILIGRFGSLRACSQL